jgi:Peroxidase
VCVNSRIKTIAPLTLTLLLLLYSCLHVCYIFANHRSIRFSPEIEHGANAGLTEGFKLLKQIKAKYDSISWADTLQMARYVCPNL